MIQALQSRRRSPPPWVVLARAVSTRRWVSPDPASTDGLAQGAVRAPGSARASRPTCPRPDPFIRPSPLAVLSTRSRPLESESVGLSRVDRRHRQGRGEHDARITAARTASGSGRSGEPTNGGKIAMPCPETGFLHAPTPGRTEGRENYLYFCTMAQAIEPCFSFSSLRRRASNRP